MAQSLLMRLRHFYFMEFDTDLLLELKRLRAQGKDVSNDDLILMQIMGLAAKQNKLANQIDAIDTRVQAIESGLNNLTAQHKEYPSVTWLLRHKPKETLMFSVGAFVLFSMWYVSGLRQPIMRLLGLPEL